MMRVQIRTRPDHLARNLSFLRWSRNFLFVIGILALGYYGYAVSRRKDFSDLSNTAV